MSSEDVLLIINHVKHKKTNGSLYLMGERLAFMPECKDSFSVSHQYVDIKAQRISPDTKDKVQLQVQFHDGGANTFHFASSQGREKQMADRESVKELLQQLLPRFRRKMDTQLEEKNRMLQNDPELFQLYKDLVVSQVITAEEFWSQRSQKQTNTKVDSQDVGVSAAFMVDIKPEADGCNGLRYNLTADIIECIFRTYPAVKKTYTENVPDKLTEKEFWTRFFQSHYFHRDRINVGNKDFFSDCAKNDEKEMQEEIKSGVNDSLIDLTSINDDTLGDGYGNTSEETASTSNPNVTMIRRFNHHSTMVLKSGSQSSEPSHKKAKIQEKLQYDDLESRTEGNGASLNLTEVDRYLQGPTPVTATQYHTSQDVIQAAAVTKQQIHNWKPNLRHCVDPGVALNVLSDLSPGGALMHGTTQQRLTEMVPTELRQELQQLYVALCELLRHFWACFPVQTKALEEKVVRMHTNLERFHSAKVKPLKVKLASYHYSVDLTAHLEKLLTTAFSKYELWHTKQVTKR